jgi:hypothetical protein
MSKMAAVNWRALLGFELSWFALVYFQYSVLLPVLVYVLYGLSKCTKSERKAVLLIAITGVVLDTLLLSLDVIEFDSTAWLPMWFILLWVVFSLASVEFMTKVLTKPWLAAILGASGGPLSYWAGATLSDGALQFPLGMYSIVALVPVWALLAIVLGTSRSLYADTV